MKPETGLIIGKFLPPHLGHQYLVDFARAYVKHLTVLVCTLAAEPIPGELRFNWMREMFPDVDIRHHIDENPQEPHEHPDFWRIWRDSIMRHCPAADVLFASEKYGIPLAKVLNARFVPVDIGRSLVPVSGTRVRERPLENWRYLPPVVRSHFVKRVCVFGPESAGKTTLARDLALHFDTVYVHEYARHLLELKPTLCEASDIPLIARGQIAAEEALARQANRVLICDTDILTTVMWSEILFGGCPDWIREEAERRMYDLYIVLEPDCPWIDDKVRYQPDQAERLAFRDRCVRELETRGRPYILVGGSWEDRFEAARHAVSRLLDESDTPVSPLESISGGAS
ncbi:MAG: AAA family ATPase [Candidatus Riflebacteria bacterium]|nr:AAA family ATPase [Candidatus Riflebacteria bacterium]